MKIRYLFKDIRKDNIHERTLEERESVENRCLGHLIEDLESKGLINDKTITLLNSLSLEDIITLKLYTAYLNSKNHVYSFSLFYSINKIVESAVIKYFTTIFPNLSQASKFLGKSYNETVDKLIEYETYNPDKFSVQNLKALQTFIEAFLFTPEGKQKTT